MSLIGEEVRVVLTCRGGEGVTTPKLSCPWWEKRLGFVVRGGEGVTCHVIFMWDSNWIIIILILASIHKRLGFIFRGVEVVLTFELSCPGLTHSPLVILLKNAVTLVLLRAKTYHKAGYRSLTSWPSDPDAKYHLAKFRHAQKAKFWDKFWV